MSPEIASQISWTAVLLATVAQFVVGAIWYMALFAKPWGEMFGFDKLSKTEQKAMAAKMGPFYGLQIAVTLLTSYVLAHFVAAFPQASAYGIAFWLWLGFVVPTQVSAVIFGGVDPKWIPRRIGIMAFGSLAWVQPLNI
jgi:hypothetical protein